MSETGGKGFVSRKKELIGAQVAAGTAPTRLPVLKRGRVQQAAR